MKLVTYRASVEAAARLGVIVDDLVVDVSMLAASQGEDLPETMLGLIDAGRPGLETLRDCLDRSEGRFPAGMATALANVKLLAPIPRPRKNVFGIGLNYVEHVAESAQSLDTSKELPKQPVVFSKPPTAVIGPGEGIEHNRKMTQQLDWEVELAVIIGTTARRVGKQDALKHVFGYSVMIDVSARDNRRAGQWIFSKGQDTYAPFGPCIVTADEIPDPQALPLWLEVNGQRQQDGNTRNMVFTVRQLVAYISCFMTLEPGDIISTGTPPGVGMGKKPPLYLKAGDTMRLGVAGLGEQRQRCVAC